MKTVEECSLKTAKRGTNEVRAKCNLIKSDFHWHVPVRGFFLFLSIFGEVLCCVVLCCVV